MLAVGGYGARRARAGSTRGGKVGGDPQPVEGDGNGGGTRRTSASRVPNLKALALVAVCGFSRIAVVGSC